MRAQIARTLQRRRPQDGLRLTGWLLSARKRDVAVNVARRFQKQLGDTAATNSLPMRARETNLCRTLQEPFRANTRQGIRALRPKAQTEPALSPSRLA